MEERWRTQGRVQMGRITQGARTQVDSAGTHPALGYPTVALHSRPEGLVAGLEQFYRGRKIAVSSFSESPSTIQLNDAASAQPFPRWFGDLKFR